MRLTTTILTSLAVMALTVVLTACSDADSDDYTYGYPQEDSAHSGGISYRGTWQTAADAINGDANKSDDPANGNIALLLNPDEPALTIVQMPVQLFLQLASHGDATPELAQPYNVSLQEKGYSAETIVYEATLPPYTCTFRQDGELHRLRLEFQDRAEVAVDNYLSTLATSITVKAVATDDEQPLKTSVTLSISAVRR